MLRHWFVCLFVRSFKHGLSKNYSNNFTKFVGKVVAHWARKERLDFGGYPDQDPGIFEGILPLRICDVANVNVNVNRTFI